MQQGFGWQGKTARRARDWDDRPPPEPRVHGAWEHLPRVALVALAIGIAAGASLIASDAREHDRVLAAAGFTPDGLPSAAP